MKNRAIIPLVVGLSVGLIAVKLSVDVVQKARAGNGSDDMLTVAVAQQMIPMGVEIKPAMVSLTKTSKSLAPQGSVDDPKKLTGRVARTQIAKGMPVIEEMLSAPGTPAGMASLVPNGYRAMAVKVEEESSVAGFLKPGCRVDVAAMLCVRSPNGGGSETISKVILQDVMVGAVGQSLTGESESATSIYRSVTLLVKPEEVAVLHMAATQGRIRLAMRHYEDVGKSRSPQVARESELDPDAPKKQEDKKGEDSGFFSKLAGLFKPAQSQAGEAPKPAWVAQVEQNKEPEQARPPFVVTVMQGNNVESVAFENSQSMQRVGNGGSGKAPGATLASAADALTGKGAAPSKTAAAAEQEPVEKDTPAPLPQRGN